MTKSCQSYLERHVDTITDAIRQTELDDHEHAFAFNDVRTTKVFLGDCNSVPRPVMEDMKGSFHTHTLEYSQFSDGDIDTFTKSQDKYLCYVVPKADAWHARCLDRELGQCGELFFPRKE